jgi:hypothetical protein
MTKDQWIKYTMDGECFVEGSPGKDDYVEHGLRTVALAEPLSFRVGLLHLQFMRDLLDAIQQVRQVQPGRLVPITLVEAPDFFHTEATPLKELLDAHLVKIEKISVPTEAWKMPLVTEAIYFTPQGRAFVRKYINNSYAITSVT